MVCSAWAPQSLSPCEGQPQLSSEQSQPDKLVPCVLYAGGRKNAVGKGLKIGFLSEELQATDRHVQFQPGRKTSVWLVTGYGWKRVSGLRSLCRLSTWEWPSSCDCLTWNRCMQPQEPGPRPVLHTPPVDRGKQRLGDLVLVCCLNDGCVTYFQG